VNLIKIKINLLILCFCVLLYAMKYIYSLWSKKLNENLGKLSKEEGAKLLRRERALMSKSLGSLIECVGTNSQIELVSDDFGINLFSGLPFGRVRNHLNKINDLSSDFWAYGKIYSLGLYNEPVCHLDYDFIIKDHNYFRKIFNDDKWDVLVQSKEISPAFYLIYQAGVDAFLGSIDSGFFKDMMELYYFESYKYAYNCGVLGFKNIEAKHEFVEKTKKMYSFFNEKENVLTKTFENHNDIPHLSIQKGKNTVNQELVNLKKYWDLANIYSVRHEHLDPTNINCMLEQFFLTVWSNYKNLYVKEVCPIEKWLKLNGNNKRMNNFNNNTTYFAHYVQQEKDNFVY
jgi:hypothetical protein